MKLISHRGLLTGPDPDIENAPDQIAFAIAAGFDVEIDVWYIDNQLYLGHDHPQYKTDIAFLKQKEVWAHAKNYPAFEYLLNNDVHCFWHENDERTLTSQGYIWTYPNKEAGSRSVIVVLDKELNINKNIFGVCGDYVSVWKETLCNLL